MAVVNPAMGAPAYVYYPSAKGCEFLAQEKEDPSFKSVCTRTPNWQYLHHWVATAETHITLDQAVMKFDDVKVVHWISEWTIANPDETEPEKRFSLYTRLGPKLVCAPDAGFLLEKHGFKMVHYLELDRDTTQPADRVAAQKCHGYAGLYEKRLHTGRHFPAANVEPFTVLFVADAEAARITASGLPSEAGRVVLQIRISN